MRMIDLAVKDLKQLVRDWKTGLFLVAMPIAFTLLLGFVFSGAGGGDEDVRLPVAIVDRDQSAVSGALLDLLATSETIRLTGLDGEGDPATQEDERDDVPAASDAVANGDLAAAVIVPAGYGAQALELAREQPRLILIADAASTAGQTAQSAVEAAASRLMGAAETARLTARAYESRGGVPDESFVRQAFDAALAAWQAPPLGIERRASGTLDAPEQEGQDEASPYTHSSAGIMVQFAIAGLMGAAQIILAERKFGALKRMLTTPISRGQILAGHFLAMLVMILVQLVILILFGQLVLGVNYLRVPAATGIMVLTTSLWAASLGLLLGILTHTEEQVIMITVMTMLVLSALGGAWVPLETTGKAFQTVGHLTPTAWAIDGLENIVLRGLGIESVGLPALVLLAYAVGSYALAAWRFRFESQAG